MPFKHKDLATHVDLKEYKKGDGKEGAWVFVVGCAPISADCPDSTQNTTYFLDEPLDHYQLDLNAKEAEFNIAFLKKALKAKLAEIKLIEQGLAARAQKRAAAASEKQGEKGRR